ncbi:sodium:solute symporter [Siphonobacter aquaeclarae]|jgi:Na+/proline symporter|uniref:Na+/proline symporter n=1 Tax=Siphonobacter aquaeclarae TaxID=563176 RepID=A0A1G9U4R6_9BACT|nr:sodium:solute symporter [Siphonobacter aquaeclarae]MBO9636865.1 sodium:solute symporter [Siphonobacter aquaeclarae]SDM54970.1 Na+/proline symporter [Siphonobacter aquaeclarae]
MNAYLALFILIGYFAVLVAVSFYTSRGADTNAFFTANKQSPWYLVAFGMIGTSLSGVTFISVPGNVNTSQFTYFQVILGYLVGYFVIANVLMPMYYKMNLISIYTYLERRFGFWSYKTGAGFFLVSRTVGSAGRMFIAVQVLQLAIFDRFGIPFEATVVFAILLIWIYTFKGGVKTIIITDTLQTFFLVTAVFLTVFLIAKQLNLNFSELWTTVQSTSYSKIFVWDWAPKNNFFKDFISGAFIAIVMTGLDQDLMQKNLTCKNIGEAKKNMLWFCVVLVIVNFAFLNLGALLLIYSQQMGIQLPAKSDDIYPMLALGNHFGIVAAITFLLGITAATYASSDSALTALTTSFCIDFLNIEKYAEKDRERIKTRVHIMFSVLFLLVIMLFRQLNSQAMIRTIFDLAGYTYGPLLGLYAVGLYTKWHVRDSYVPVVCLVSPLLTYLIVTNSEGLFGYTFGFEKLLLNGFITLVGLALLRQPKPLAA